MVIWGNLLHLSYNMWEDTADPATLPAERRHRALSDELQLDESLWNEITERCAEVGMNMIVIDLGDAVRYDSHPEIALRNAWSVERLRIELARLRGLGLEPIPKLNFSAGHDTWMGQYHRQVSTPAYYKVCSDLIAEVSAVFDTPRFFHLGMDEETAEHQRHQEYVVIRQHDLWWRDLNFLCKQARKAGSRPWVWSDPAWRSPDSYYKRMPIDVLQSNWYYRTGFGTVDETDRPRLLDGQDDRYLTYLDLDDHGYDQVPTASNHVTGGEYVGQDNVEATVEFCTQRLQPQHLYGFLQTPWKPTTSNFRDHHLEAVEQVGRAVKKFG